MDEIHPASAATTELAVRPAQVAVRGPASVVIVKARWRLIRIIRERPYAGPQDRPRSVVLLAGLVALVICGVPCLVVLLAKEIAR